MTYEEAKVVIHNFLAQHQKEHQSLVKMDEVLGQARDAEQFLSELDSVSQAKIAELENLEKRIDELQVSVSDLSVEQERLQHNIRQFGTEEETMIANAEKAAENHRIELFHKAEQEVQREIFEYKKDITEYEEQLHDVKEDLRVTTEKLEIANIELEKVEGNVSRARKLLLEMAQGLEEK